jgi:hypothetical protein
MEGGRMGYRNKTYVIFDADNDMWAYAFMKGWKVNDRVDFDFYDAHDVNKLLDASNEETVKRKLRERLDNTKQAIVLVGDKTKDLYRYVRWELETCLTLGIPIVAANLNGMRMIDETRCPSIIKREQVMHVAFKMKIIKYALDDFCGNVSQYKGLVDLYYRDWVYANLGL